MEIDEKEPAFQFLGVDSETKDAGEGGPSPSFKSDLLEHYNLRVLYDHLVDTKWEPPRKVGKAQYFVYSTIEGDGHLRSEADESCKYNLAPIAENRKATQETKLRAVGGKSAREAFSLDPGHFELPKVEIGVAIHKRDKKDRDKRLKLQVQAAETKSYVSKETTI